MRPPALPRGTRGLAPTRPPPAPENYPLLLPPRPGLSVAEAPGDQDTLLGPQGVGRGPRLGKKDHRGDGDGSPKGSLPRGRGERVQLGLGCLPGEHLPLGPLGGRPLLAAHGGRSGCRGGSGEGSACGRASGGVGASGPWGGGQRGVPLHKEPPLPGTRARGGRRPGPAHPQGWGPLSSRVPSGSEASWALARLQPP